MLADLLDCAPGDVPATHEDWMRAIESHPMRVIPPRPPNEAPEEDDPVEREEYERAREQFERTKKIEPLKLDD